MRISASKRYGVECNNAVNNASLAQVNRVEPTHMETLAEIAERIEGSAERLERFLHRFEGEKPVPVPPELPRNGGHRDIISKLSEVASRLEDFGREIDRIG